MIFLYARLLPSGNKIRNVWGKRGYTDLGSRNNLTPLANWDQKRHKTRPLLTRGEEKETLQKFGLTTKKYITINREVGDTQLVDSTKLWPLEYYRKLIADLKETAPQYQIIEVGCGKGE